MVEKSASRQIDDIIKRSKDWRGETLSELRALIKKADPGLVEEVKWKKPSKPEGVPVWSHDGILCVADTLKNAVRLTFPKGAQMKDPKNLFNTRLDSKSVRAIDFHEDAPVDGRALKAAHSRGGPCQYPEIARPIIPRRATGSEHFRYRRTRALHGFCGLQLNRAFCLVASKSPKLTPSGVYARAANSKSVRLRVH